MQHVLLLLDDRPGNCSQVLGVGKALEHLTEVTLLKHQFHYSKLVKLPNIIRQYIDTKSKPILKLDVKPDIIIAAGRRSAPLALSLKKQYKDVFLCHLMWPEIQIDQFDLIALPEHDQPKYARFKNTFFTLLAPGKLLPKDLSDTVTDRFQHLPRPHISVLIGGSSKHGTFNEQHAYQLVEYLSKIQAQTGGSLLVTSSRRTGGKQTDIIKDGLKQYSHFLYDWRTGAENPYRQMLATADYFVVTEDSVSMLSECLVTGKPTYLFEFGQQNPFKTLHTTLEQQNIIRRYSEHSASTYEPIVPALDIAKEILRMRSL